MLQARAEARAYLHAIGEFDFEEATEPLYCYAIECGLVAELGLERVREVIEAEFVPAYNDPDAHSMDQRAQDGNHTDEDDPRYEP